LSAQNGDSGKRNFFVKAVVSNLVYDVDQLADIFEEVSLQKIVFA
jgi:hypothetical protein